MSTSNAQAKLDYIAGTKTAIKDAIELKGVVVGAETFRNYATKISEIGVDPLVGLYVWGNTSYVSGIAPRLSLVDSAEWSMVSLGDIHGLAIKNGELYSWGQRSAGRLGDGLSSGFTLVPTKVGSFTDWHMVSAGTSHSLGIRKTWNGGTSQYDYTLWVWGGGIFYSLGTNATTDVLTPTQIGSDVDWTYCSAGQYWSSAIKGGKLYTCGYSNVYQTGQNTTTSVQVWTNYDAGSTGWTMCTAGVAHGLGLKDGELWSWGNNGSGRTGQGTATGNTLIPTKVGLDTNWSSLAAGSTHSAAIKSTGTVWTFGINLSGQLGLGNTTQYTTPQQVGVDTDWTAVACNSGSAATNAVEFTYAIKGGALYAAGLNNQGQIGQPLAMASSNVFVQIGTASNYIGIGAGSAYGMAIRV